MSRFINTELKSDSSDSELYSEKKKKKTGSKFDAALMAKLEKSESEF